MEALQNTVTQTLYIPVSLPEMTGFQLVEAIIAETIRRQDSGMDLDDVFLASLGR